MRDAPQADPWIVRAQPRPDARLRVFCFPYAGGSASIYRTWSAQLAPDVEVCAIQLPGREARLRELPFVRLTAIVDRLAREILPYCDRPFVFFGHSMGALISFELARALRQQQHDEPKHLFVSGCRAPHVPDPDEPIHHLPSHAFVDELRRLNGTPEEVLRHAELLELLMPTLRADFAVVETYTYTPSPALECPITAFGGIDDERVSRDALAAWQQHTTGGFKMRMFTGDHFFIRSEQAALVQTLSSYLAP